MLNRRPIGEGGERKMRDAVAFLLGIAAGIAGYRVYIINLIHRYPYTACDYCKFTHEQKNYGHLRSDYFSSVADMFGTDVDYLLIGASGVLGEKGA